MNKKELKVVFKDIIDGKILKNINIKFDDYSIRITNKQNTLKYLRTVDNNYRKLHNEKRKNNYINKKIDGRCPKCGRKPIEGLISCYKCREKDKNIKYNKYSKRKEKGLCVICGKNKPVKGYINCFECNKKKNKWQKNKRKNK